MNSALYIVYFLWLHFNEMKSFIAFKKFIRPSHWHSETLRNRKHIWYCESEMAAYCAKDFFHNIRLFTEIRYNWLYISYLFIYICIWLYSSVELKRFYLYVFIGQWICLICNYDPNSQYSSNISNGNCFIANRSCRKHSSTKYSMNEMPRIAALICLYVYR